VLGVRRLSRFLMSPPLPLFPPCGCRYALRLLEDAVAKAPKGMGLEDSGVFFRASNDLSDFLSKLAPTKQVVHGPRNFDLVT
jgi:hypothetical protein